MKALCTSLAAIALGFGLCSCLGPSATKATTMGAAVGAATAGPVGAAAGAVSGNIYGAVRDRRDRKKAENTPAPAPASQPQPATETVPGTMQPADSGTVSGSIVSSP